MENLKIRVSNEEESKEAQQLFFELGATLGNGDHHAVMVPGAIGLAVIDGLINFVFNQIVHSDIAQAREITLPQLRDMVVLHRNDVNDATHINLVTGSRALLACGKNYYWQNEKWNEYPCGVDVKPIDKQQPDPATSPNEIAKKEYLLPKGQGYELCLCEEGMTIHASWIEVPEGAEVAVLFEPAMVSNRSGELFFWKDNGDTHYVYSERSEVLRPTGWYSCKDNQLTTLDEFLRSWKGDCRVVWRREQSAASPNDIAKTAEVHREHNLSNELNDLCAEFGCPPGMDRFAWLKDQLDISQGRVSLGPLATKARMQQESMELRLALLKDLFQPQPVTYHYAASINTARGTVAYDGVITMPQRITGMEDYLQARTEIAKDGNVAPEQVNIHSLSIIS